MDPLSRLIFAIAAVLFVAMPVVGQAALPVQIEVAGPEAMGGFGYSVRCAGDLNLDGAADFVVGAPFVTGSWGAAGVISGATGAYLQSVLGRAAGEQLGYSVAGIGDINGDGFPDWAAGAPMASGGGRVSVYSGLTGTLMFDLYGEFSGDRFGYAVECAGDVNGDGFSDFAVGAPFWDRSATGDTDTGKVYVFTGPNGTLFDTSEGDSSNDLFGSSLACAGDLDGDGMDELICGARWYDMPPFSNVGRVYVQSPANGTQLYSFDGEFGGDQFGVAVSGGGDLDNDGTPDILIGAMQNDVGAANVGRAYAYSGATGALMYVWTGQNAQDHIGAAISNAGDVNGDGHDDVIIGGLTFPLGTGQGIVQVFSGYDGSLLFEELGATNGGFFGYSVDTAGDVNGDLLDDVVVGAIYDPVAGGLGLPTGKIRVFSLAGARRFGAGFGAPFPLDLSWTATSSTRRAEGELRVAGGPSHGSGVLGVSLAPMSGLVGGTPVLIDSAPGQFLFLASFMFNSTGQFAVEINLNEPILDGLSLYLQAAEMSVSTRTSNGLQLLFSR